MYVLFQTLLTEVCDETKIAELKVKVDKILYKLAILFITITTIYEFSY